MKKKTIFTTITFGLVTLLGLGFLGAINSQPKEAKAVNEPTYYFHFGKNLGSSANTPMANQEGYFNIDYKGNWVVSSMYLHCNGSYVIQNEQATAISRIGFLLDPSASTPAQSDSFKVITINAVDVNGNYLPNIVENYEITSYGQNTYFAVSGSNYWEFDGSFKISDISYLGFIHYYCDIFINFDSSSTSFTFASNYNYNAFAQNQTPNLINRAKQPFIEWSTPTQTDLDNDLKVSFTFDIGYFLSNGRLYNNITAVYQWTGSPDKFETYNGELITSSTYDSWQTMKDITFIEMYYSLNNTSNKTLVANRQIGFYTGSTAYFPFNASWLNDSYRVIQLYDYASLTNMQKDILAMANNNNIGYGYGATGADIGLSNAFSLIALAFTSFIPILSISVVPGITLGLLLFLPLIAGIIIFIIWVVKR